MKRVDANFKHSLLLPVMGLLIGCTAFAASSAAQATAKPPASRKTIAASVITTPGQKTFASAQQAADDLIAAADKFDQSALSEIFGPDGKDIVFSGEIAQDRKHAEEFVAKAREKKTVNVDSAGNRAFLQVGNDDWPFPVPIVKTGAKWSFDSSAGKRELLFRRIGENELDAIGVCHGYVEAQYDYAFRQRELYEANQYAQRIVSSPGKHDGLAWQNDDGTWGGPVGEKIANAIEQGYNIESDPYHGYYFKILKGQGPAAPLGKIDYVVKGAMIGGFALVAAPAEYTVTGVRTFIVSQDGVVYEKDLGPSTLDEFGKIDRFNPDDTWSPVNTD